MWPRPENTSSPGQDAEVSSEPEFTPSERRQLLGLAHEAILSALQQRGISFAASTPRFEAPRGAFTTIYLDGSLRGCVGYPLPIASLHRTIVETARGAAFEDVRFPAVSLDEAPELEVSLSILSPLRPAAPEDVRVGVHGLLISQHGRRGLLLPQVPVEHGWDRVIFLEQTCRKAGLPAEAWRLGAAVETFTAEVFADSDFVNLAG